MASSARQSRAGLKGW
jgi:DNA-directed RNA polymerase alpha subunit